MNNFSKEFYKEDIIKAINSKKEIEFEILKENTVYSDDFAGNDWVKCPSASLPIGDVALILNKAEINDQGYFIRTIVLVAYYEGMVSFKIKDDKTYSVKITWN